VREYKRSPETNILIFNAIMEMKIFSRNYLTFFMSCYNNIISICSPSDQPLRLWRGYFFQEVPYAA